ncbi:carboxypeptidase regulatory-like domain-containing protein [Haliangium sp.]|uniref:carboxypeptidase regulatory-like domain-containing protein n=1 Tax=Haliangium sp. TaxID=2663208 RepID=UPI003D1063EA
MATVRQAVTTFAVTGTVYGGSTALEGVTVSALADGTTTVVASDVTDASGHYELTVEAGTYDLQVVPAAGSGFGDELVQNVEVSADVNQDIVLLPEADTATLSGTVTGQGGSPVSNLRIRAYVNDLFVTSVQTEADGSYSIDVPVGAVRFDFDQGSEHVPGGSYYCRRTLDISGDATIDHALPLVRVQGVTKSESESVGNTQIAVYVSRTIAGEYCYASHSVTSDVDGQYSFITPTGNVRVRANPPNDTDYGAVQEYLTLSSDTTHDIVLPRETTLSGTVTGRGGEPVANAYVRMYGPGRTYTTYTDENGHYSAVVTPGAYSIYLDDSTPRSPNAPTEYTCYHTNVAVSSSTTRDFALPAARVTGAVTGPEGSAVGDATVRLYSYHNATNFACSGTVEVTTDADGSYTLLGFASSAGYSGRFSVYPPASLDLGPASEDTPVTDGMTKDFSLAAALTLSGVVKGHQGGAVGNAIVYAYRDNITLSTTADQNGAYSFKVSAGTYRLQVRGGSSTNAPSSYYYCYFYNVGVTDHHTFDPALPVVRLRGEITDFNSAPVPGVNIRTDNRSYSDTDLYCYNYGQSVNSNSAGGYSFLSLKKTTDIRITPPTASGFAPAKLSSVVLDRDLDQRIILQRPDRTPPIIVSGPTVIHLSDTSVSINWTTNEPSDSQAAYGIDDLSETAGQVELVTAHSVTLLNLEPAAIYQVQVSSTDEAGNGPTTSEIITFTTQPPPGDITPPVITAGPGVAFIDQTNALVQWQTDEPASSVVHFGLSADALDQTVSSPATVFAQSHLVTLSGLTPSTIYFARVESTDPDGNGPTASDVFSFTTSDVPDTQAPVIVSGPTIADATDTTITVTWVTDEAATSGVSYTDGTVFDLVTDDTLVTAHSITLANLSPSTEYSITVSSRDAVGNGPTLAGPITGSTLDTPDVDAPLITDVASAVTETTVSISWLTDELATSRVDYAPSAGGPAGTVGDVSLSDTHVLSITGLTANTTYVFTVTSVDASGNSATSEQHEFTTLRGNTAPVANAGPDQSVSCAAAGSTLAVTLDGSGSSDPDDDPLSYAWSSGGVPLATGVSPTIALEPGTHTIRLVVDDGRVSSPADEVQITVVDCADVCTRPEGQCTAECPCGVGEGDCDSADECAPGLMCLRDAGPAYGYDDPELDVCAPVCPDIGVGAGNYCSEECPCEAGEGDCDSDSECAPGLVCARDVGLEYGYSDRDTDVCAPACPDVGVGGGSFCSEECPCEVGEGDCDSDDQCAPGLMCLRDAGPAYGYDDPELDVCAPVCPDIGVGAGNYCSAECPCDAGEGDCDSDADCAAGLTCAHDVGDQHGFEREVDVCEALTSEG